MDESVTFRILSISVNQNTLFTCPEKNVDGLFRVKSMGEQFESGFSRQIISNREHGTVYKTSLDSPIKTVLPTQGKILMSVGKGDRKIYHLELMLDDQSKKEGMVIPQGVRKYGKDPAQFLESFRITTNGEKNFRVDPCEIEQK
jgi:hypothetical protein